MHQPIIYSDALHSPYQHYNYTIIPCLTPSLNVCSVERLIFNRTPSSGLLPIFLPWIFLGGILGHGKLFELFLSPGLDLTNHFCTVCPPPTFRSWLRHGAWRMFYLRSRPCHPIFVKLSSYIDRRWAARSACCISLFEVYTTFLTN